MKEKVLFLIGISVIIGLISMFTVSVKRVGNEEINNPTEDFSGVSPNNPIDPINPSPTNPSNPTNPGAGGGVGGSVGTGGCQPTGCSGQVCSDKDIMTTCEFREEYACYSKARCERQTNGECGWTETESFRQCLLNITPAY